MENTYYERLLEFFLELKQFIKELAVFLRDKFHLTFLRFEEGKGVFATALYRRRGKMARRFVHSSMAVLVAVGMMIAPVIAQEFPGTSVDPWEIPSTSIVLSATTENTNISTLVSEKIRAEAIEYTVAEGDTVSTIAEKFGVSEDTVRWQNSIGSNGKIKVGQTIEILPVTGISHKVSKGDTVYSIAKRYDTSAQAMVDFPYNTFTNDETFELAIGQVVVVPEGIMPSARGTAPRIRQLTPNAGTVVASGSFVWPAGGKITQNFVWYHKGIDIANKSAPAVLAADSGTVVVAGWVDGYGYGNRVLIDHGNGYRTLYAHLASVYVRPGQTVNRGDSIGGMGSTGRSTGVHLHFEVIGNGVYQNPLSVLR